MSQQDYFIEFARELGAHPILPISRQDFPRWCGVSMT